MPEPLLPVIVRMLYGEPIALFPTLPGTPDPRTCLSYLQGGQHGSADAGLRGRQATAREAAPLLRELRRLGYRLRRVARSCPAYAHARWRALRSDGPPDGWTECSCCGHYHPPAFAGDCRDDSNRWPPSR